MNDASVFGRRLDRHSRRLEFWVKSMMGRLLRSKVTPEDVLQETFLQALRSADTFEDRGEGSFRRWLVSIARNRILDISKYFTSQKRDPRREAVLAGPETGDSGLAGKLPGVTTTPGAKAAKQEQLERLAEAMHRLPEALRDIVLMRYVEGLSYREIAEALDGSPTTVQGHHVRALRILKRDLGGSQTL